MSSQLDNILETLHVHQLDISKFIVDLLVFLLNKLLKSATCLHQLFRIDDDGLVL